MLSKKEIRTKVERALVECELNIDLSAPRWGGEGMLLQYEEEDSYSFSSDDFRRRGLKEREERNREEKIPVETLREFYNNPSNEGVSYWDVNPSHRYDCTEFGGEIDPRAGGMEAMSVSIAPLEEGMD